LADFWRIFFRALFSRLPASAMLVFDNAQEVADDARLFEAIRVAAAEVGSESNIVVLSRTPPPVTFAPLTANNALFTLDWDKLRLTLDETRIVCAARNVRDDWLVRALHQQSQGWAAGITLMLERLGSSSGDSKILPNETREAVFNYFATLLFDQAPASTRHALLSVAFLPQMTATTAAEISGDSAAAQVLENLYERHLFTDRRNDAEPQYQFHALFRAFLQSKALATLGIQRCAVLQRRSAEALERAEDVSAAVELYATLSDWPAIVRLLSSHAPRLLGHLRWQTVEDWIRTLPPSLRESDYEVCYWLGMAQLSHDKEGAIASLEQARSLAQDNGSRRRCLSSLLSISHLHSLERAADSWLDAFIATFDDFARAIEHSRDPQLLGTFCFQLLSMRPWHPLATTLPGLAVRSVADKPPSAVTVMAAANAVLSAAVSGDFDLAEQVFDYVLTGLDQVEMDATRECWALMCLSHTRFLQVRYEEALTLNMRAGEIAREAGLRETLYQVLLYRFSIQLRGSDWEVAAGTLREVEAMPLSVRTMSVAFLRVHQARRACLFEHWPEAAELAAKTQVGIDVVGVPLMQAMYGYILADIFLAAGRTADAAECLGSARAIIERSPALDWNRASLEFAQAMLVYVQGDLIAARNQLQLALDQARTGTRRHLLLFLDSSTPVLFKFALTDGIEVDFVRELIRLLRLKPPKDAPDLWPRAVMIRTLGRFEVIVNGERLEFPRKLPKKTLALLKVLIAQGPREVTENYLCDSLWGDEEADAARHTLGITILRLRKLLGCNEAIVNQGGKVWLDRDRCWVDAWRFEELIERSHETGAIDRATELYVGAFLREDEGEAWSVSTRERLTGKFIDAVTSLGRALESEARIDEALQLYKRGLDADTIIEPFHQGLMRCYQKQGRHSEAVSAFRRLRQTLSVVLGVAPSKKSDALHAQILAEMRSK
jgi:DNA-binding SARP family transcriptional activator